jgi:hypothetical protein
MNYAVPTIYVFGQKETSATGFYCKIPYRPCR